MCMMHMLPLARVQGMRSAMGRFFVLVQDDHYVMEHG